MANEAWKTTGDCNECRRFPYCNNQCTANRKRVERLAKEAAVKAFAATLKEDTTKIEEGVE